MQYYQERKTRICVVPHAYVLLFHKREDLQRIMPTSKAQVYAFFVVISRVVFVHVGHALSVNRLEATK